ncbi:hypothetical protein AVEN_17883-1 [Araneus ventricosus]|uniref:Uncharacterized protein n=1 Tax=Araneus ventricosus TaxID=182803 RepID=A0A4Y2I537_ARAVE|nr:hypothetical protein AVEN_17883-1 [Araneus ventricosus]
MYIPKFVLRVPRSAFGLSSERTRKQTSCQFHRRNKTYLPNRWKTELTNSVTMLVDPESFCAHDTESEEYGDSGNEDGNNLEWFSSKNGVQWKKTKFRQNIRCQNIVSRLPGKQDQRKM